MYPREDSHVSENGPTPLHMSVALTVEADMRRGRWGNGDAYDYMSLYL